MALVSWLFEKGEKYIESACQTLGAQCPDRLIVTDNRPYLHRYYLFRRSWLKVRIAEYLPSVYLHKFYRGDDDRALHDHPWGYSISLILTNGYLEDRATKHGVIRRLLRPGSLNVIRANDYHRVDLLDPKKHAWTLFISGTRVQKWSFWDHTKPKRAPIPWDVYLKDRDKWQN